VVDFIRRWSEKTDFSIERLLGWVELSVGKFYDWGQRYGQTNQHNGRVPRDSGYRIRRSKRSWTFFFFSNSCTRWKDTGG